MGEDAGLKLLAAIEALSAEIRGMREDLTQEREARGLLEARRAKDRERKAKIPRKSEEDSAEFRGTVQVVKRDLDQDHSKDLPNPRKSAEKPSPKVTGSVWLAYSTEYRKVYGAEPVRNAKVNGQLAQLLKRIPEENAPDVAAFYLSHKASRYSQVGHSVGMLLFDCEKLHTEWLTGRKMNGAPPNQPQTFHKMQQDERLAVFGSLLKGDANGMGGGGAQRDRGSVDGDSRADRGDVQQTGSPALPGIARALSGRGGS